jgi:hypothetical protein
LFQRIYGEGTAWVSAADKFENEFKPPLSQLFEPNQAFSTAAFATDAGRGERFNAMGSWEGLEESLGGACGNMDCDSCGP